MNVEDKTIIKLFYDRISGNRFDLESYNKICENFLFNQYNFDKYLIYWRHDNMLCYENIVNDLVQYYLDEIKKKQKIVKSKIEFYKKLNNDLNIIQSNLDSDFIPEDQYPYPKYCKGCDKKCLKGKMVIMRKDYEDSTNLIACTGYPSVKK